MLRVVAFTVCGDWPGQAAGLAGVVQPGGAQFEVALFGQACGHLRRLEEVTTTVHLWHGEQDPTVPIIIARQMAASLPHCQAHFGAGGHLMACDHAGEILTTVTSAFDQDAKQA